MENLKIFELKIDEYVVEIYCEESNESMFKILNESKQRGMISLGGAYSATKHQPHNLQSQYHLHVYLRNNQICALNLDGTGHDGSHGFAIPNKVHDALVKLFPDKHIPKVIESVSKESLDSIEMLLKRLMP